jgi:hypothetical protein
MIVRCSSDEAVCIDFCNDGRIMHSSYTPESRLIIKIASITS